MQPHSQGIKHSHPSQMQGQGMNNQNMGLAYPNQGVPTQQHHGMGGQLPGMAMGAYNQQLHANNFYPP